MDKSDEFSKFDDAMRRILSVPRRELLKREKEYKRKRAKKKRAKT